MSSTYTAVRLEAGSSGMDLRKFVVTGVTLFGFFPAVQKPPGSKLQRIRLQNQKHPKKKQEATIRFNMNDFVVIMGVNTLLFWIRDMFCTQHVGTRRVQNAS